MKITFNTSPNSFETFTIDLPLNIDAIDIFNVEADEFIKLPYKDEEFVKQFHSTICVGDYGDYVGDALYYDFKKEENVSVPDYEYDKAKTDISFYISAEHGNDKPFVTMCVDFHDDKMHEYEGAIDAPKVHLDSDEQARLMCTVVDVLACKLFGVTYVTTGLDGTEIRGTF